MLHAWNIFLVISTFSLSLLGTFLVRSGVLSSVHAFATDPGRGAYILGFMTIVLGTSFGIFMARGRYQQAEESVNSLLSRESLFVWNNVLFTVACACVMLGTLYPLALDALDGAKLTVGAPYFNVVMVPIFLVVMLLMAIGPLVPWRKANPQRLRQHLLVPVPQTFSPRKPLRRSSAKPLHEFLKRILTQHPQLSSPDAASLRCLLRDGDSPKEGGCPQEAGTHPS